MLCIFCYRGRVQRYVPRLHRIAWVTCGRCDGTGLRGEELVRALAAREAS